MSDPEEFQPSLLPDDPAIVEADGADVEEQSQEVPDPDGGSLPTANSAQASSGPEPEGPRDDIA